MHTMLEVKKEGTREVYCAGVCTGHKWKLCQDKSIHPSKKQLHIKLSINSVFISQITHILGPVDARFKDHFTYQVPHDYTWIQGRETSITWGMIYMCCCKDTRFE